MCVSKRMPAHERCDATYSCIRLMSSFWMLGCSGCWASRSTTAACSCANSDWMSSPAAHNTRHGIAKHSTLVSCWAGADGDVWLRCLVTDGLIGCHCRKGLRPCSLRTPLPPSCGVRRTADNSRDRQKRAPLPPSTCHSLSLCGLPDVDATSVSCSTAGQLTCSLCGDCWRRNLAWHLRAAHTAWQAGQQGCIAIKVG